MSTAEEIEHAIRTLEESERDKHLPQLFAELAGDVQWEQIIRDNQPRPAFSELLDSYEAELAARSDTYPKVAASDFDEPSA